MNSRPRLFVWLALAHFFEPLFKVLWMKIDTQFSWALVINNLMQMEGIKNWFEFWFLFPLGAVALLSVRSWSYFVFMGVQLYSIYSIAFYEKFTWPYVAERPFLFTWLLVIFNAAIVLYFALPNIRRPFFDRRLRWWQARQRYGAEIACEVDIMGPLGSITTKILNISQSGAFLELKEGMVIGRPIKLTFHWYNETFSLNGMIVNRHVYNGIEGLGVAFHFATLKEQWHMRRFIYKLSRTFKNSYSYETT
jgi:hypothetical protein